MPAASRDPAKPRPGLDGSSADRHAGGCGRSVLANALIVLEDAILHGRLAMEDGLIAEIRASGDEVPPGAADLSGDLLIPGLIDLHTDHLERHYIPRPNVTWDPLMAVLAHDAQIIGAGITTAFDCLALSGVKSGVDRAAAYGPLLHGLTAAAEMGALRADHLVHLRCELTDETVPGRVAALEGEGRVRMLSVMDHTPGDRQFADPALWLERHRLSSGLPDDELLRLRERRLAARTEVGARRAAVAAVARRRMLPLASHDDASAGQVEEAHSLGASITEFPTTMEAADAARARGIAILMGAPNMVRGRSHVGNLSAADCAQAGLLDVLASDYVPAALLPAAFLLTTPSFGYALPRAVATVTINPARAAKLLDRGRIAAGLRADLVRVRPTPALPVVREVWREGCRVH